MAKKTLKVVKFSALAKKAGNAKAVPVLPAKKAKANKKAAALGAVDGFAAADSVQTVIINNVTPGMLDVTLGGLRADPRVISTQVIPEGDGEFTIIVQFRG